jgi:hypothetical protein
VDVDNHAFDAEFDEAAAGDPMEGQISNANTISGEGESPSRLEEQGPQLATTDPSASKKVNVFDYEIPSFDNEMESGQEMQERGRPGILSAAGAVQPSRTMDST